VDFAAGFFAEGRYGFNFRMTSYLIKAHPVIVSLNSNIPFASQSELSGLNYGVRFGTDEQRARALALVTADNKITLLAERLERLRKEEDAHGAEKETA
jgi:hypothetical protein